MMFYCARNRRTGVGRGPDAATTLGMEGLIVPAPEGKDDDDVFQPFTRS